MRKTVIFIISFILILSCATLKNPKSTQGISGQVRWVEGNLMPTMGDTTYIERSKGKPIQRELYIFRAVKSDEVISASGTFYKQVEGKLIRRIQSKKDGAFKAALPPGKYSIFVMEKEGYFANIFDGEGYINPVTVHEGEFTELQIMVNYKAFY